MTQRYLTLTVISPLEGGRGFVNVEFGSRTRRGLPWRSSGENSALPVQGTWVPSLYWELRLHKPLSWGKKKKKNRKKPERHICKHSLKQKTETVNSSGLVL